MESLRTFELDGEPVSALGANERLPRERNHSSWAQLAGSYGRAAEELKSANFDLRLAHFAPHGSDRVSESGLRNWREALNEWAYDEKSFPAPLREDQKAAWDVDLGLRLVEDLDGHPEFYDPDVWCWFATHLLPHFVVHRWGWPKAIDGEVPKGRSSWSRFGNGDKNALFLSIHRVVTYGPDLAKRATQQEFQSIQYRPAYGLDQRVALVILKTLVDAYEDQGSCYGKKPDTSKPGNRALDCNHVCIELRYINSLRPLCFATDDQIAEIVSETISRLPELRERKASPELLMDEEG